MLKLLLDEHVAQAVAAGLRRRSLIVVCLAEWENGEFLGLSQEVRTPTCHFASRGVITSMPNLAGAVPYFRTLKVISRFARPFTAVSRTISSLGSRNCGLQR